jgi:hypothetical protein
VFCIKIKYLERCKFFPIKFAVRVEVRLTIWAETNILKLRRYATCKLHQSSPVTPFGIGQTFGYDEACHTGMKQRQYAIPVDTRGKMMLRAG